MGSEMCIRDRWLPTEIFDFDIQPSASGPIKHIKGGVDMPLSRDR